ncbi:MAG TPA: AIR synthase related protein [Allosphingosinicella sp.]|nr:AIR synthase related protein [Allosphingosinicella sp.]
MVHDDLTLAEVGEFRLIDEVVLPLAEALGLGNTGGDDCAFVEAQGTIAVSADVGPRPLVRSIPGYENDFEAAGWLAVVATASDIATAGAKPLFLTNCVDAPADLRVGDLRKFLTGAFRACAAFGFANGGGDLRQGSRLEMRTFAAGSAPGGARLGRSGAKAGDHLVLIGRAGEVMANYLLARCGAPDVVREGLLTPATETLLRFPRPQVHAMPLLAERKLLVAASDTSDGLIGAIMNMAKASRCGFDLELAAAMLPPAVRQAADASGYSPWNIYFAWGDWSVAAAVPVTRLDEFASVCATESITWTPLGRASGNRGLISARIDGLGPHEVTPLRNENFLDLGFNAGLDAHLGHILGTSLFTTARSSGRLQ